MELLVETNKGLNNIPNETREGVKDGNRPVLEARKVED
jgi:hypothetical protein